MDVFLHFYRHCTGGVPLQADQLRAIWARRCRLLHQLHHHSGGIGIDGRNTPSSRGGTGGSRSLFSSSSIRRLDTPDEHAGREDGERLGIGDQVSSCVWSSERQLLIYGCMFTVILFLVFRQPLLGGLLDLDDWLFVNAPLCRALSPLPSEPQAFLAKCKDYV